MSIAPRSDVAGLEGYHSPQVAVDVRLNTNESPYPPPPEFLTALAELVGSSALQAGSVAALSQFIAWPGQLVFSGQAQVLYDGGALNVPTLHGVVVRNAFAAASRHALIAQACSVGKSANRVLMPWSWCTSETLRSLRAFLTRRS